MARKQRTPEERSDDPAALEMLNRADEIGVGTAFSRACSFTAEHARNTLSNGHAKNRRICVACYCDGNNFRNYIRHILGINT